MGRTIPSFRIAEAQELAEWKSYRKALLPRDRLAFDDMLSSARLYTSASSSAIRPSRFEGIAMAVVFHHYTLLTKALGAAAEVVKEEER